MLPFAMVIVLILSALFPSMRLDAAPTPSGLHLTIAKERKETFQVHYECIYPPFVMDSKVTVVGDTQKPEATLTDFKSVPEPKEKPTFPTPKMEFDDHYRPVKLESRVAWVDLISLLGTLPTTDLAIGKEYPYEWVTETFPVKGSVVFKGEVGDDLLLVATGKSKMGKLNLDVKHTLLFPKGGGPVREIRVEMKDPRGLGMNWSAKRIP